MKTEVCRKGLQFAHSSNASKPPFTAYTSCVKTAVAAVSTKCLPSLLQKCQNSPIKTIKTVRASVEEIADLKNRFPSLKVVHLVRDPRAVVMSRLDQPWALHFRTKFRTQTTLSLTERNPSRNSSAGAAARRNVTRQVSQDMRSAMDAEMFLFCDLVRRNELSLRETERKYPDTTFTHIYEGLMDDPMSASKSLLSFLGLQNSTSFQLSSFVDKVGSGSTSKSRKISSFNSTTDLNNSFQKICRPLLKELAKNNAQVKHYWAL